MGDHLRVRMTIYEEDVHSEQGILPKIPIASIDETQLPTLLYRDDVLIQETRSFPRIGFYCPFPMLFITPEGRILEGWAEIPVPVTLDGSSTMIEVQVGKEYIRDVIPMESFCS